ncbi:hypothetical protein CVT24_010217 [Panaeolus cyanescens]|uniref:GST N-terminal domain-containing protein n=1 Tax=Panaeolus cyanescens TaxID=181874 RepID=A0A409YPU3_9AGAR|nr:hypothetical protein CVT24_010217 [Panaeolus cyanescens]
MIIFYDIDSNLPGRAFSPNTWKTRFTLNYKGIPYKTEWFEFVDIQSHCESLSIVPKSRRSNGELYYSLPAIWDTTTGVKMCESLEILEYLEKTYPDQPTLFPGNTKGLQLAFQEGIMHTGFSALFPFIIPDEIPVFSPRSREFFVSSREQYMGIALKDMKPTGERAEKEWAKFKAGLEVLSGWYEATDGPFLMGDTIGWADIAMASWILWIKLVYENDPRWKDVSSWSGGRWERLLDDVKPYTTID